MLLLARSAAADDATPPPPHASPAAPLSVRIIAPQKAIIGELVRITLDETGDVRERDWSIEPAVASMLFTKDRTVAYLTTPTPGVYTIDVAIAGKERGIARHKAKLEFSFHDPAAKPAVGKTLAEKAAARDPSAEVRQWASEIQSPTKARDVMDLVTALKMARNIPEAKAFFTSSAGASAAHWAPFWKHLEKLFADLDADGQLPTEANRRGALSNTAKALEGGP